MSHPPVSVPCKECPWRRVAATGFLGPYTPEEWLDLAHGEQMIACHMTIDGEGGWKQCRGAAIYRANVAKSPRDASLAVGPTDPETVFASRVEFLAHHQS